MEHLKLTSSNSLKGLLVLVALIFAASASGLIIAFTSADGGGDTPNTAVSLTDEPVTGSLNPGEQHWFTFSPQGNTVEQSLSLEFSPNSGNTINFVTLNVFEDHQIPFFDNGDASAMFNFGAGQIAATTPESGILSWTGFVSESTVYYIQVSNSSDFTIEYTLSKSPIETMLEEADKSATDAETASEPQTQPARVIEVNTNNGPDTATELNGDKVEGRLAPNSTYWYTFTPDKEGSKKFKDMQYTLFFTPDDGNRKRKVNFKLYPYSEYEKWQRGDAAKMANFGAGSVVDRDGDDVTGELLWSGSVVRGDKYLLAVTNGNDITIDYHLFSGDIIKPHLGAEPEPEPRPVFAERESPQTASPLRLGVNEGGLDPGEEAWYSFSIADFDNEAFEEMALTMVTTPDDGNRIHHINFEVFTADAVKNWSSADYYSVTNLGAGGIVYRDDNDLTGERFWKGWVVDNDLYYVRVTNNAKAHMDYHLFTGDVYGPELGEKTQPVVRQDDPGTSPWAPLDFMLGVNRGQLNPGEERWYTFMRGDAATGGIIDTTFTMVVIPADGNVLQKVHFKLFELDQVKAWAPDNPDVNGFGQGSVVNQGSGLALLWKGQVLGGGKYLMQVINQSNVAIEYGIYPEEVINANLE